jgi:hypothetical protein
VVDVFVIAAQGGQIQRRQQHQKDDKIWAGHECARASYQAVRRPGAAGRGRRTIPWASRLLGDLADFFRELVNAFGGRKVAGYPPPHFGIARLGIPKRSKQGFNTEDTKHHGDPRRDSNFHNNRRSDCSTLLSSRVYTARRAASLWMKTGATESPRHREVVATYRSHNEAVRRGSGLEPTKTRPESLLRN